MRRMVADSVGRNDQCFLNSALAPSEREQVKNVEESFKSSSCLPSEVLELFTPFGRKKFWHDSSIRSLSLANA